MKIFYDPSALGKRIFPETVWGTACNKILLTFDDGPNKETTPVILNTLEKLGIKAVFFVVGENAKKNPELLKDILSAGNEIGNHTFNHRTITRLTKDEIGNQILLTNRAVEEATGKGVKYFRPPKGRIDFRLQKILKGFNLRNVMWNLLTYDYKNDLNIVKFAFQKYLKHNSIVVLHDNQKNKGIIEASIRFAVETAQEKKLHFGEPSECLK